MLAGVLTRRYRRTQEPVGEQTEVKAKSTSKSSVSRTFKERTKRALGELMSRSLADMRLAAMMIDGLELKGRMMIVALGIATDGVKVPLGLWEGDTENATVVTALLSDLVERGLDPEQGMLFMIDGSKALRKAIRKVFGERVPVQRCLRHKERNVMDHLPESDRPAVKARLRRAWAESDHHRALAQLKRLAADLDRTHPGAARSLREGMEETLTVTRLGINGKLRKTLESTNPCESTIDCVRTTHRNVKRWRDGEMGLRWTAAGMLEAEKQFRKVSATPSCRNSPSRPRISPPFPSPIPFRPRRPLPSQPRNHHTPDRHRNSTPSGRFSGRIQCIDSPLQLRVSSIKA